jgi:hypothetical protein
VLRGNYLIDRTRHLHLDIPEAFVISKKSVQKWKYIVKNRCPSRQQFLVQRYKTTRFFLYIIIPATLPSGSFPVTIRFQETRWKM